MRFHVAQLSKNRPVSDSACIHQSGHAHRMSCLECELPDLLAVSGPPDPALVDLIEQAFLEGKIDNQKAEPTYL